MVQCCTASSDMNRWWGEESRHEWERWESGGSEETETDPTLADAVASLRWKLVVSATTDEWRMAAIYV